MFLHLSFTPIITRESNITLTQTRTQTTGEQESQHFGERFQEFCTEKHTFRSTSVRHTANLSAFPRRRGPQDTMPVSLFRYRGTKSSKASISLACQYTFCIQKESLSSRLQGAYRLWHTQCKSSRTHLLPPVAVAREGDSLGLCTMSRVGVDLFRFLTRFGLYTAGSLCNQ